MADLVALIPPEWAKKLKPFLLRAQEFQARQPAVAYHLKTYVTGEAMKLRSKTDPQPLQQAGTKFVMAVLDACEKEKASLGEEAGDGRTVLTKTAFMLFSKADDQERTGQANLALVKLFFAASQLFEATAQFTSDGALDPIVKEKFEYSKFIAFKMKKALDSGTPYVSPNEIELPEGAAPAETATPPPPAPAQPQPQPPVYSQQPPPPQNTSGLPAYQPPSADDAAFFGQPLPPHQASQTAPAPPAQPQYQQPPPQPAAPQPPAPPQPVPPQPAMKNESFTPAGHQTEPGVGGAPSMDAMIKSQKYAKQAVAALQFFDHTNARQQLLLALAALDSTD